MRGRSSKRAMSLPAITEQEEVAFDGPYSYCDSVCLNRGESYYDSTAECTRRCLARHQGNRVLATGPLAGPPTTHKQLVCRDACLDLPPANPGAIRACQQRCLVDH